jgi:hypothetical protein
MKTFSTVDAQVVVAARDVMEATNAACRKIKQRAWQ